MVVTDFTDDVNVDTCPFARVVDVVTPFLSSAQFVLPSMLIIPSPILDGSAPRVMATVRATEFPVMLDSGAEVSVLPVELAEIFRPPVQLPDDVQEVRTFGPSNVVLRGLIPLEISLCGIQLRHPFFFGDATRFPPTVGYDFMWAARLVVDVDNNLVWSRHIHASIPSSPNPPVSVPNPTVRACVSFIPPQSSVPPSVDVSPSATTVTAPVSDSPASQVEPDSSPSSVVSRQVSVVLPPPGCHASTLNPAASLFRPRANSSVQDALRPRADPSQQPRYLPVYPLVDPDDTLVKTLPQAGSIFSITLQSSDTSVPPHLQELFDATVSHANLSQSLQQNLAAVMRSNGDAFATGPLDLGFCSVLQHDIDTGDSPPIKQSPRRPPFAARDAEDAILDEMLQTGVIEPSHSPWSSPICMVKKKDDTFRFCIDYGRLNDVTKKDAFPVPDIKDALDSLRGAKYFATIDLLCGYWQLGLSDRMRQGAFHLLYSSWSFPLHPYAVWPFQCSIFLLPAYAHHSQRHAVHSVSLLFGRYHGLW